MNDEDWTTQRMRKSSVARIVKLMKPRETFDDCFTRLLDEREQHLEDAQ